MDYGNFLRKVLKKDELLNFNFILILELEEFIINID